MVAPSLPGTWRFVDVSIGTSEIVARYVDPPRSARAEIKLTPRTGGGVQTAEFSAYLRASSSGEETRALFAALVRAIRAHEHDFDWHGDDPTLARFEELASLGRYPEALMLAERELQRSRSVALLLASARLRATLHDENRAVDEARAALALGSDSVSVGVRAASILARFRAEDMATTVLDRVVIRASSPVVLEQIAALYLHLGLFTRAIDLYERVVTPSAQLAIGTYRAFCGDGEGAADRSRAVLANDPKNADAWCLSGIAHALSGDSAAALEAFERALLLDPSDATAALWRAESLLRLHQYEAARDEAARAGNLTYDRTSHVPALLLRAATLDHFGVREPVEPVLERAMEALSPGAPTDWQAALAALRGNRTAMVTMVRDGTLERVTLPVAMRMASKHAVWRFAATASIEETERDFDRIAAMFPAAAEPHNYRGEVFLYVGDSARARRCFEQALALNARSRWAFIGLSAAALLEGRPELTLEVLAESTHLSAPGPTAYVYRGEAHRRLGHLAEAYADLTHAVTLNPTRIGAWVNLALLHAHLGEQTALDATMKELDERAPAFVVDAREACDSNDVVAVLEEMLSMLRGNRASSCVTYFTRDGRLRSVPPQHGRSRAHG